LNQRCEHGHLRETICTSCALKALVSDETVAKPSAFELKFASAEASLFEALSGFCKAYPENVALFLPRLIVNALPITDGTVAVLEKLVRGIIRLEDALEKSKVANH